MDHLGIFDKIHASLLVVTTIAVLRALKYLPIAENATSTCLGELAHTWSYSMHTCY